ncbi:hypothetical protein ACFYPH_27385 [Micromonospora sp. NPDC005252]|uniref:hypothetical protein n=1 Tax=Micromonospora sp. NPDC005252 TaxID=3364228 RepID=UPI0036B9ED08
MGEELGGEGGADAGQAGEDLPQLVLGDHRGDSFLDGGDAVVDRFEVGGHLTHDQGRGGLSRDGDGLCPRGGVNFGGECLGGPHAVLA